MSLFHRSFQKFWFVLKNSAPFNNQEIGCLLSYGITSFILFFRDLLWTVITVWTTTQAPWKTNPTFLWNHKKFTYKIGRLRTNRVYKNHAQPAVLEILKWHRHLDRLNASLVWPFLPVWSFTYQRKPHGQELHSSLPTVMHKTSVKYLLGK